MLKLLPHQVSGVDWLSARGNAGLFDQMGLGKTITAIAAADAVGAERLLVVCPALVLHNWAREIEKWSPHRKIQVVTTGADRIDARAGAVVVSHGLLIRDPILRQLEDRAWDVNVVDEAHAFRNPKSQRTKALYGVPGREDVDSLISRCARTWTLTGTPAPNNPTEVWTMVAALAPERLQQNGRLMRWHEFRARYCKLAPSSYGDGWKVVGIQNAVELRARLKGFALRRLKSDHLDLPPLRWGHVTLDGADVDLKKALREAGIDLDEIISNAFGEHEQAADHEARMNALRESHHFAAYRRIVGLLKAPAAAELLGAELTHESTHKKVLFCHHLDVATELRSRLRKFGAVRITGAESPKQRQANVDAFQRDPRVRVAVCNIVAGGVGITLTAAHDVVLVEQSWIPGENLQAADRCHRIGQTRPVLARVLSLAKSSDEIIAEVLLRKTQMIQELLS